VNHSKIPDIIFPNSFTRAITLMSCY